MQPREKWLAIFLSTAVVLWFGGSYLFSGILGPLQDRREQLATANNDLDRKRIELGAVALARREYNDWLTQSLPPDPLPRNAKPGGLPGAVIAQRLYQQWVLDVCELCAIEQLVVRSDRPPSRNTVFASVPVSIKGEATHAQYLKLVDLLRRTRLLQRVIRGTIVSPEAQGDPTLSFTLELEGLAMAAAPARQILFQRAELAAAVNSDDVLLQVSNEAEFSAQKDLQSGKEFFVRLGRELLAVTAREGNRWTVRRGCEGTTAAAHDAQELVEYWPLMAVPAEPLPANLFVKPAPPVEYRPKLTPPTAKTVQPGERVDLTIVATGFDTSRGKPEYVLTGTPPAGATLDGATGLFRWATPDDAPIRTYAIPFEVRHPSVPGGKLTGSVIVQLKRPNASPVAKDLTTQVVYLGQNWKYELPVTDAETPRDKLTWKLSEGAPAGLAIDGKGALSWTPADSTSLGELSLTVEVTDRGDPPATTKVPLSLKVEDDAARFTVLIGIVAQGTDLQAWFYNRLQDRKTVCRPGDVLTIAELSIRIVGMAENRLEVELAGKPRALQVGDPLARLRQMP